MVPGGAVGVFGCQSSGGMWVSPLTLLWAGWQGKLLRSCRDGRQGCREKLRAAYGDRDMAGILRPSPSAPRTPGAPFRLRMTHRLGRQSSRWECRFFRSLRSDGMAGAVVSWKCEEADHAMIRLRVEGSVGKVSEHRPHRGSHRRRHPHGSRHRQTKALLRRCDRRRSSHDRRQRRDADRPGSYVRHQSCRGLCR